MPSLEEAVAQYDAAKKALAEHLVREIRDRGVTELVLERIRDVAPAPARHPGTNARRVAPSTRIGGLPEKLCTFPGCGKKHNSKGLCKAHDHQRRRGTLLFDGGSLAGKKDVGSSNERTPNGKLLCKIHGCGKPRLGRGYCAMHYYRHVRNLPMDAPPGRLGVSARSKRKTKPTREESQRSIDEDGADLAAGQAAGRLGNPRPFVGTVDGLAPTRKMDCEAYKNCLSYAGDQKWPSWTCAGCKGPGVQNEIRGRGDGKYG